MINTKMFYQSRDDLRAWMISQVRLGIAAGAVAPADALLARQVDALVALYKALTDVVGLPPTPDLLRQLGQPGALVRDVCNGGRGTWVAFREIAARQHPELAYPTPRVEDGVELDSFAERLVLRALLPLSGVTSIKVHPFLPGGSGMRADFRLTAVGGRSAWVEVAMVPTDPAADTPVLRDYRGRFDSKYGVYRGLGIEPVVFHAEELAPPRVLTSKVNEVLDRLGLPRRPLPPPAWFEGVLGGEGV